MAQDHFPELLCGGAGKQFSGLQVMRRPAEDPRISPCGTADGHPVAARLYQHLLRGLRPRHISVSDHGNLHRGLHLGDDVPVRLSGIELLSRPSMYGDGGRAALLGDVGQLHRIDMLLVKAFADLHRHRLLHRRSDRRNDPSRQQGILHQGGTFPIVHHLGNRAAHIDVQNGKGPLLYFFCHLRHQLRLAAEKLQGNRALLIMNFQQAFRIFIFIINSLGAHHFAAHQPRSLLSAEQTKWQVAYPCHWCENHPVVQSHVSDPKLIHSCPFIHFHSPKSRVGKCIT